MNFYATEQMQQAYMAERMGEARAARRGRQATAARRLSRRAERAAAMARVAVARSL
jgi:hypothetical protein